jgi:hypothetical protein
MEMLFSGSLTLLDNGTAVSFRAVGNTGYEFVNWTGALTSSSLTDSLIMTSNAAVGADFDLVYDMLTINVNVDDTAEDGWLIEVTNDGDVTFIPLTDNLDGTYSELIPHGVYRIFVNGGAGRVYTGVTITVNTITTGTLNYYTLVLDAGTGITSVNDPNSSGTSVTGIYLAGSSVTIDASVDTASGYVWSEWTSVPLTFGSVSLKNTTITMPSYALELTANAVLNTYTITLTGAGAGGSYEYCIDGVLPFLPVIGNTIDVPHGSDVEIRAVIASGYEFEWDTPHRIDVDVNGVLTVYGVTTSGTVNGEFTALLSDGNNNALWILVIVLIVLAVMIIAGYLSRKEEEEQ